MHCMHNNTVSFFNLLTKSQVSFLMERDYHSDILNEIYITITTRESRIFLLGGYERPIYEFYIASNSIKERAKFEVRGAAVCYGPDQDKIFVMGGYDTSACAYYEVNKDEWTNFT